MTIADTVFDTIKDNWGSGGYGGAAPAIDTTETQKSHDETTTDVVEVRHYTLRETGDQRNDTYVDRHYSLDIYISSKTSNAQLKLLYDEVEYLLRNTAMTGLQLEAIDKDWNVSQWEQGRHSVVLRVRLLAPLSDGAVTSAAGVTASMQALLMYGSANGAWIPCMFTLESVMAHSTAAAGFIKNADGQDESLFLWLPLSTLKGTLKLYVTGLMIDLTSATVANYITAVYVYGMKYTGGTAFTVTDYDTNRTAQGQYTYAMADTDCSTYDLIAVRIDTVVADAVTFVLGAVRLSCFYDT